MTVADVLVRGLARAGARAVFGLPGGGSNLDVIAAARRHGLPFVLAHTETGSAIMAAAQAEITGAPGVCLSTLGPGVSSIVNGVAHAHLDRVPLIVLTDALELTARARFEHQTLPHAALLGPIVRLSAELMGEGIAALVDQAIARAMGAPPGPVHLDCTAGAFAARVAGGEPTDGGHRSGPGATSPAGGDEPPRVSPGVARLLGTARRPLLIAGLGASDPATAAAAQALCERRIVPALVTYKAKGVVADAHPSYAGLFTLGEIERPLVDRADLIITAGLDPVELLPREWACRQPVVHCARWAAGPQLPAGETIIGDVAAALAAISRCLSDRSDWSGAELVEHRERQRLAVTIDGGGFTPAEAMSVIAAESSRARHVTVDAGAHMLPAMALVPADRPRRVLISNGLSTMGFALPAAIGAALLSEGEPVVAITGDAGLLLCLGELRTLARAALPVVVVVVADDELSLIRVKQARRGLDPDGVRIGAMDWPLVARGLGLHGSRAGDAGALRRQLAEALEAGAPALIEARVDPSGYGEMLRSVRG
jgi:acetolactate synthase-1/2/3 large subunit